MSLLRLAYTTQFLIALIAILTIWSQVGGPDDFDLTPWYLKLALSTGAAFAIVKATAAAVSRERAWNAGTLKWFGVLLAILIACGLVTLWVHRNMQDDENGDPNASTAAIHSPAGGRSPKLCGAGSQPNATYFSLYRTFAQLLGWTGHSAAPIARHSRPCDSATPACATRPS
jgi:hypothetical protein